MARHVEGPWFRAGRNTWCATISGQTVNLRIKGAENRKEAESAWHQLMAKAASPDPVTNPLSPSPISTEPTLTVLAESFLATKRGVIKKETVTVYTSLLARITSAMGDRTASSLKSWEVSKWLAELPVGSNTKHDIGGIFSSLLRWAEEEGILATNPLKKLKRPARQSRGTKAVLGPNDHEKFLAAAYPALRDLLTVLYETGARPSEATRLEASHCDFANSVAVLTEHKTADSTGKPRMIVLSPVAVGVLKRLAELHPAGPLLLNGKNRRWKKDAMMLAVRRLSAKVGIKVTSYCYRHDFATKALANGVPDATVAALLGHSNTTMLHKHYGHLTSQSRALREALSKVRVEKEKPPTGSAEGGEGQV